MTLGPRLRWALGATLLACAVVAWLDEPAEAPVAAAPSRALRARATPAPSSPAAVASVASARWPEAVRAPSDEGWAALAPLAAAAWTSAPVSTAAPVPAAAPVARAAIEAPAAAPAAPPFPYQWIGRIDDQGQVRALLEGPRRTLAVRAGEVIDRDWRVEAVGDDALSLLWLPGGKRLNLSYRPA